MTHSPTGWQDPNSPVDNPTLGAETFGHLCMTPPTASPVVYLHQRQKSA